MPDPVVAPEIASAAAKTGSFWPMLLVGILGLPASWKGMGMMFDFFRRRFDEKDALVTKLVEQLSREHEVRMKEAEAKIVSAAAQMESAKAHTIAAEAHKSASEAMLEFMNAIRRKFESDSIT